MEEEKKSVERVAELCFTDIIHFPFPNKVLEANAAIIEIRCFDSKKKSYFWIFHERLELRGTARVSDSDVK